MAKAVSAFFATNSALPVRSTLSWKDQPAVATNSDVLKRNALKREKGPGFSPAATPSNTTSVFAFMGNVPKILLGDCIKPGHLWKLILKFNGAYASSFDTSEVALDPCTGVYGPTPLAQALCLRMRRTLVRQRGSQHTLEKILGYSAS